MNKELKNFSIKLFFFQSFLFLFQLFIFYSKTEI
jgi:hypothetical protein